MMHEHIEDEEVFERYARNQLGPAERQAFEEHFFACEECFEKLQATERFIAGVRDAARRGRLAAEVPARTAAWRVGAWFIPAFGVSACAALGLAALSGWLYFFQLPRMRGQLSQSAAELRSEQAKRAALEQEVARGNQAEVNVPLVMLQATRDVQASPNEVVLPRSAQHLLLWLEVPPGNSRSYRLQLDTADNRPVQKLENLKRNPYGALAVSLPAEVLQPGEYRIRVSRQEPLPTTLLGEYRLRVRRP